MLRILDPVTLKPIPLDEQDKRVNAPKSEENVGQDPRKRRSEKKKDAKS